jgi:hypothetical protein
MTSMVSKGQYPRETVVNKTNPMKIAGMMDSWANYQTGEMSGGI